MIMHYKAGDWDSLRAVGLELKALKKGNYLITVKRNTPIRTLKDNAYYWGVVLKTISIETGIEDKDLHELFKAKFNTKLIVLKNGWTEAVPGSTSKMDEIAFKAFVTRVCEFAATNMGIPIPERGSVRQDMIEQIRQIYDDTHNKI